MSVDICLNIGTYMIVPKINGFEVESFKKCPNTSCKCKKKLEANFCPQCGTPTEVVTKNNPCKNSVLEDWDDLHDIFELPHAGGAEISSKFDYYVAIADDKEEEKKLGIVDINPDHSGGDDLSKIDASSAIAYFNEKYAKEIAFIRAAGVEPEICWGLFTSYA